jgi:hypothetical protein
MLDGLPSAMGRRGGALAAVQGSRFRSRPEHLWKCCLIMRAKKQARKLLSESSMKYPRQKYHVNFPTLPNSREPGLIVGILDNAQVSGFDQPVLQSHRIFLLERCRYKRSGSLTVVDECGLFDGRSRLNAMMFT